MLRLRTIGVRAGRLRGLVLGPILPEVSRRFYMQEHDGHRHQDSGEHERSDEVRGIEHPRVVGDDEAGGSDWQEEQDSRDQSRREASSRHDVGSNVEEDRVDQHQRRKCQRHAGDRAREFRRHDAEDDHKEVDDVEVVPFDGQLDDGARPVAPVELEFFECVDAVGAGGEPDPVREVHRERSVDLLQDRIRSGDRLYAAHKNYGRYGSNGRFTSFRLRVAGNVRSVSDEFLVCRWLLRFAEPCPDGVCSGIFLRTKARAHPRRAVIRQSRNPRAGVNNCIDFVIALPNLPGPGLESPV